MIDKIGPFVFDNQYIIFCSHKVRKFIYFLIYLIENQCAESALQADALFSKGRSTITEHLKNIFETGELDQNSVCRKFRRTAADGKNYETQFYNLDAIISVGYRVNSRRATV